MLNYIKYVINKFKELKNIKNDYMNYSPRKKWLFVRNIGIFFSKTVGMEFLDPEFKVWWYSYFPGFIIGSIFLSFLYTLWYYTIFGEPFKGLLLLSGVGSIIAVRNIIINYYFIKLNIL